MNDRDKAFFQPLWRRVLTTAFCTVWSAVEWYTGDPFWGVLSAGVAGYCYWALIWRFDQD